MFLKNFKVENYSDSKQVRFSMVTLFIPSDMKETLNH